VFRTHANRLENAGLCPTVARMYETLSIAREDHLTWLTLNRPDALNALSRRMVDEVRDFFWRLADDRETRVVVVRGAGRAFCAGLDLKEAGSGDAAGGGSAPGFLRSQRHISELVMLMRRAPQPIIAAVHGAAAGGGFAIALAADVRVAGESARMNAAFIRLGLSACDVGVSYFLPRLVGASVASELLLTGDFIDAARAERTGLVSRVVPDDQLESCARTLAESMLRNSPLALRLTKECLKHSIDAGSLEQAIAMEDRNQALAASTRDFREGVAAFLQKRPAIFEDA
jgi:enoyl-CoA hydratase